MTQAHRWPLVPLGEVLRERRERPCLEAILGGECPIVSKISFQTGQLHFRIEYQTRTEMILIRPGDLVVSGINAYKGAVALHESSTDACATIHYCSYIVNVGRAAPRFLWYLLRSQRFKELLEQYVPGGIKTELKAKRLLPIPIPLPPLEEQRRIVAKLDHLATKIEEARSIRVAVLNRLQGLLRAVFARVTFRAKYRRMREVAPLVRRQIEPKEDETYPELGIRSFGKGTFHKPALNGLEVGTKKLYRIEPGDLVFNNVFAWEGAVAVAQPEDAGRFGSHRFITCVPERDVATADFLCFYFLTPEGLDKLGKASPGGAGRNRTLGLEKLAEIDVPVPPIEVQIRFDALQGQVKELINASNEEMAKLDALLPAILDRAFKGEL